MSIPIKSLLTVIIRALLQLGAGYLVSKGLLDAEELPGFIESATNWILGGIVFFVTIGWSIWRKAQEIKKVNQLKQAAVIAVVQAGTPKAVESVEKLEEIVQKI